MPLIKICGIRRPEDAQLAADLGAAALGFVFWPRSPRFIDPYRARPIIRGLPPLVTTVGVFVDQPEDYVRGVAGLLNLGAVQLHGAESPTAYARASFRVIKAVGVSDTFEAGSLNTIPAVVTVLLDTHDPEKRGGTGRTIDWSRAAPAARLRRVILSGGLTPENVGTAIRVVDPYAVDVSSGVETAPGIKSESKLRAFVDAVRAAPIQADASCGQGTRP